ncbi:MAG: hypothetical protein PUG67_02050 [Peptoniphilaceae bacterium]|nr:hypothetical protein [Peptoniphilaceae bacterium]MDY6019211.1 hypothetical protein [Anaerococcus sp.]
MAKLKENILGIITALFVGMIFSTISNVLLGQANLLDSLIGSSMLLIIGLLGYVLSYIVNIKVLSPVLWASLLAIFLASPISPVSEVLIHYVELISLNALITYILAYAGVIVGKDWIAFKKVGLKGIIVSIFVIVGTFLISSLMGEFFLKVFK